MEMKDVMVDGCSGQWITLVMKVLSQQLFIHTRELMENANITNQQLPSKTQCTLMLQLALKLLYKQLLLFNQYLLPLKLINQYSNLTQRELSHQNHAEHKLITEFWLLVTMLLKKLILLRIHGEKAGEIKDMSELEWMEMVKVFAVFNNLIHIQIENGEDEMNFMISLSYWLIHSF